ncbi:MAG: hypothetical protein LBE38_09310 [Deltaproteobacteria bacterium]|jgi:tRNA1(Val) A37 N6-methylase TrmN6|nr:hypothetical protein [Deltaproteobacteria bacterium]
MAFTFNLSLTQDDWAQPQDGYRFSRDSILLAALAPPFQGVRLACDLGAGCGVVGLEALVNGNYPSLKTLFLVEKDRSFLPFLESNIERARALMEKPPDIKILLKDWCNLSPADFGGPLDYLTSNPPYFDLISARPSRHGDLARRASGNKLADFVACAQRIMAPMGIFTLSFPKRRYYELVKLLSLGFRTLKIDYPPRRRSSLALITLQKTCSCSQ